MQVMKLELQLQVLLLIVVIGLAILYYYKLSAYEQFKNNDSKISTGKTIIKKTQKKRCVWKHPKNSYSIWEAEPMGDYFPVSQLFQKGIKEPKQSCILIKSNDVDEKDKPLSYVPILQLTSTHALWVPRCNKGYSALGHIVSDKEPSIHQYRCVPTCNTQSTKLEKIVVKHKDYQLWTLKHSPYFAGLNLYNLQDKEQIPKLALRALLPDRFIIETSLRHAFTTKYDKISTHKNPFTEQTISIWRPRVPKNQPYVPLGDIVRNHTEDPNGKIETLLLHKQDVKMPLHYGKDPMIIIDDEETNESISFWKPVAPEGYVSLGYIANKGKDEPQSTTYVGCVPLEMTLSLKSCPKHMKQVWNNQPKTKEDLQSMWMDEFNLFHIQTGSVSLNCDSLSPFPLLNKQVLKIKEDTKDKVLSFSVVFEIAKNNKIDFTKQQKIESIRSTLSSISNTHPLRFVFVKEDPKTNKQHFSISKRKLKSNTKKSSEVYIHLKKHLETLHIEDKEKHIPVYDEESKEVIGFITTIELA